MEKRHNLISAENIWKEIEKVYDPTFLRLLTHVSGARLYAFGGIVTDPPLGKEWKDLDVRVILDIPAKERDAAVHRILHEHTTIVQEFSFPDGTVYRVKVLGGKDMIIDVGVANDFSKFRADFKAAAIFVDLSSGEILELANGCLDDYDNGLIRTLDDPAAQLEFEPRIMFRALKFAAKTGFAINVELEKLFLEKKGLVATALEETVDHIRSNGKDSVAEYYLGNIFGGLKSRPTYYVDGLIKYGFLDETCRYLQRLCGLSDKITPISTSPVFEEQLSLSENVAVFLSIIAHAISSDPTSTFEQLKKLFALDTTRTDGNEFVINPDEVVYRY